MTEPVAEPDWVQHAVLWHLYPLGFLGAEATRAEPDAPVRHRLRALEPWLDHAVELGASGLLLGPVFASVTHGYDTTDHLRVDPRLGDEADLVALVDAAHARGLRVVLDGVFNHVGQDFAMFQQALAEGPSSSAARWFRLHWPDPDAPDGGGTPSHDDFEGHSALVALNHEEPAVAEYVEHVMTYWLDRGVDGWRMDAAYAVPPSFWAPVLQRVRARHPEAYVVGEVIHGDYQAIVAESGMDSVTQYELWKAIWSSLNDRNAWELDHALRRHADFTQTFAPLTFVGNHDVTRIASRLTDPRHLDHALAVLLTVPGTPCVYAGDEHGFTGVKEDRAGGDDAVRPPFPASPAELSELGRPVYHRHQELIGLRRRHPWLHTAQLEVLQVSDPFLVYAAREADGDGSLVVLLSTDDDDVRWGLPAGVPVGGDGPATVLAGTGTLADGGRTVVLPPHGWAVVAAG
ncbi:alpha-amylase family protein [Georgenia sp. H159]|uniref:alpha-amylase family protein n=1 Tax=Georgenia sp. H159 TaxID=3076115 RepID=UPI002D789FF6|nr:alpha-amylase family protein [Georgenia sp. H159]